LSIRIHRFTTEGEETMAQATTTHRRQTSNRTPTQTQRPGGTRSRRGKPAHAIPAIFRTEVTYLPPLPQLEQREDVMQMLGAANQVFEDSPAAAIGMCGVIACFDHPYRAFAVTELLKFLHKAPWSRELQDIANATTEQEAENYRRALTAGERYDTEPLLRLELRKQEIRLTGYFCGQPTDVAKIGYEATRIARQLEQVSSRAQAAAHIIAAAAFQFAAAGTRRPVVTWDPQVWDELRKGVSLVVQVHGGNGKAEHVVAKVAESPSMTMGTGTPMKRAK
jgi:hypothetical protein